MKKKIFVILVILATVIATGVLFWKESLKPTKNITQGSSPVESKKEISEDASFFKPTIPLPTATPASEKVTVLPEIVWGNRSKKQVILTFDAGADNNSLIKILETLKKYNLRTTFFLTGKWVEKNPDLTKRIASEGHEIYNHTYSHPHLTQTSDIEIVDEFKRTDRLITNLTGKSTRPYFRPPYGERNSHVLEVAAKEGYQSVYWTVDALDWKESEGITSEEVKSRIYTNLKPGTIYLLHIGDNITGNILDEVIAHLISEGYSIVSLSEGVK